MKRSVRPTAKHAAMQPARFLPGRQPTVKYREFRGAKKACNRKLDIQAKAAAQYFFALHKMPSRQLGISFRII
jgi:hypothetical protein